MSSGFAGANPYAPIQQPVQSYAPPQPGYTNPGYYAPAGNNAPAGVYAATPGPAAAPRKWGKWVAGGGAGVFLFIQFILIIGVSATVGVIAADVIDIRRLVKQLAGEP